MALYWDIRRTKLLDEIKDPEINEKFWELNYLLTNWIIDNKENFGSYESSAKFEEEDIEKFKNDEKTKHYFFDICKHTKERVENIFSILPKLVGMKVWSRS